jgi:hypothetical protein
MRRSDLSVGAEPLPKEVVVEVVALRWLLMVLASVVAIVVVAQAAFAADNPPIVGVGPVSDPTGSVTGSGTVGSTGQVDACVGSPQDTASVNDACQSSGSAGAQTGGSSGSGSGSGTGGSTGAGAKTGGVAGAAATATVAARDARGIRIVRIRYVKSALRSAGRLRVIVTVRDVDGRLIRDAIVSLRPLRAAKPTLAGSIATFSNRLGEARFSVPVAKRLLGRRLTFTINARTPGARALELASVRLSPSATG